MFGIGLSRTGTASLTSALSLLGYKAEHFPSDAGTRRELAQFLAKPRHTLDLSVLGRVDAITDTPVSASYQALDQSYPGSRFVLTTRERASWLASCERYWVERLLPAMARATPEVAEYVELVNRTIYGISHFDRDVFSDTYDRHIAEVSRYFRDRPGDVLIINICAGEGWPQLCEFVCAGVPAGAFPHANRAEEA